MFKPSKELVEFIKKKEGLRTKPYEDFDGRKAVGYGDTSNVSGPISEIEAEARLTKRLEEGASRLAQGIKRADLKQSQIDALLDVEYNMGYGKMSNLLELVNNGADSDVVNALGSYTKARNKKGELVELPGLVERSRARQKMWGDTLVAQVSQTPEIQGGRDIFNDASSIDLDAAINSIDVGTSGAVNLDEAINSIDIAPVQQPKNSAAAGFNFAADLNEDPAYVDEKEKARKFSREENVPFDEAEALIFQRDPSLVKIKREAETISKYFPELAQWASDPVNFKRVKNNPKAYTRLAAATQNLNPSVMDDLKRVYKENLWMPIEAVYAAGAIMGRISPEDAGKVLNDIELERQATPYSKYAGDISKVGQAFQKATNALTSEGASAVRTIGDIFTGDIGAIEGLKKAYEAGSVTADQVYESLKAIKDNPEAFALMGAQSISSAILPLAGRAAGGAMGSITGPVGAVAGQATGAYMGSFLLGFGLKIKEELEAFRDPETGKIDMRTALADPARVSKWKAIAANYSGAMAIVDTLFTLKAGQFAGQATTASTRVGRAVQKAGQLTQGAAVQAVGEGLSEGAGQVQAANVAQFYGEPFTLERGLGIISNAVQESAFSIIPGAATEGTAAVGVRTFTASKEILARKLKQIEKAKETNSVYSASQEVRDAIEAAPELKSSPEDVKAFIDTTTRQPQPTMESTSDDIDVKVEEEAIFARMLDTRSQVNVTAADFDIYMEAAGVDPLAVLQGMPQETIDQYNIAKREGGSFDVDYADWVASTLEYKNIDAIARFNGSEMSPIQARAVEQKFNENPFEDLLEASDEPPAIPDEEVPPIIEGDDVTTDGTKITVVEGDEDSDLVLRPVELTSRFRSTEEKSLFKKFVSAFKKSTAKSPAIDPEAVEAISELEFEHMKFRARILNTTPAALMRMMSVGTTNEAGTKGLFQRQKGYGNPYKVAFNTIADAKTMIHELGHSWLHELSEDFVFLNNIPEENRTAEQKELMALTEVLVKEINSRGFKMENISQLYERSKEEVTAIHEMFSQTTEMWAFESKFENNRMRYIMEYFRQWLVKLADIMGKTYPDYPPMKITPEIERLFTLLTNADTLVNEELLPMFSQPEYPEGFFGKDQDKYMQAWYDARSEAVGEFVSKVIRQNYREREASIKNAINELRAKATEEVDQLPGMQVLKNFQQSYDLYRANEIDFDPRISEKSFREVFAGNDLLKSEQLKKQIPNVFYAGIKKGGLDAKDIMAQMGINSVEDMIGLMIQASQRDQLIEQRTNELIEQDFPAFKSDEEIHKAAVEAINSRGREKLVNETFNLLKNKYPAEFRRLIEQGMLPNSAFGTKELKLFLQDKAREEIMKRSVVGLKPLKLMDDSDRLGKEAASMFRRGDIEEAMELKYKQVQKFYQAREALAALRELARGEAIKKKTVKMYADQAKHADYDVDLLQYATDLIAQSSKNFNFLGLNKNAIAAVSGVTQTNVDDVNAMIENVRTMGAYFPGEKATVEVMKAFNDTIETLFILARNAKKIEVGGKVLALEAAVSSSVNEVGSPASTDPKVTREQLESFSVSSAWHLKNLSSISFDRMLSSLFKTDKEYTDSVIGQKMNDIKEAEGRRTQVVNEIRQELNKAAKAAFKEDTFSFSKDGILMSLGLSSKSDQVIQSPELNVTFRNKAQLVSFLLQTGSEDGLRKVLLGGVNNSGPLAAVDPLTGRMDTEKLDAFIERLIQEGELTAKDFEFMQVVWKSFEKMYPELKKTQREIRGINLGYIEGRDIKTSLGTFKGGYVPITQSAPFLDRGRNELFLDPGAGEMMAALVPPISKSSTIARNGRVYDVDLDLGRILSKINGVANLAYVYPSMVEFGKMLARPEVQEALESRRPAIMAKVVYPWFKRTSLQQYTEPSDQTNLIMNTAKTLRNNIPLIFYLFNPASVFKQPIGIVQAVPVVGAKDILVAMAQFAANPNAAVRAMTTISPRMKARHQKGQTQLIQDFDRLNLNFTVTSRVREFSRDFSFFFIQWAQNYTDAVVWNAAYRKALGEGSTLRNARIQADDTVEKTQGSTGVSGLANIQAGNDLMKVFTQLTTVPLALRGVSYEGGARNEALMDKLKFYTMFTAFAIVAASGAEQLVGGVFREVSKSMKGEEDEDEKLKKRGFSDAAIADKNMSDFVLRLLGQGVETVFPIAGRNLTGLMLYNKVQLSPAASTAIKSVTTAAGAVGDINKGIDLTGQQVKAILDTFTLITGIPLTLLDFGLKLNEGSKTESEKLQEEFVRRNQRRMNRLEEMR